MKVRRCTTCTHPWFLHRYKIRYSIPVGACNATTEDSTGQHPCRCKEYK